MNEDGFGLLVLRTIYKGFLEITCDLLQREYLIITLAFYRHLSEMRNNINTMYNTI